jgi:hypothetical protein
MTRLAHGLLLAAVAGQCGCLGLKPVGPMAELFPPTNPATTKVAPGVKAGAAKDAAGPPALAPAPPPPAPSLLVSPAEVTPATADEMARKLAAELEADRKALEAMPKYAEVSVVGKK